ncbi:hypothetical protein RIR_jg33740.t1 [Rhizophagus irregularis DAOM 181602=DAOM 197198]|nr:hypothetical protein RIR_jg33740.t1 [Rhizophagus irregularis DAOM 181602=DAOM 197198]
MNGSGGLPKNGKRRTFKIRLGGFPSFQGTEKTKDSFSGLPKNNGKPRFVRFGIFRKSGTKIRLVSRVDSDKQKKPKILLVGFQKIKIRKYIRIHE